MDSKGLTSTETKWTERVTAWRASGQGPEEFALHKGFEGSTLRYWASRLRTLSRPTTAKAPARTAPRLVPLVARPVSRTTSPAVPSAPPPFARPSHVDEMSRSLLASPDIHVEFGGVRIRVGPGSDLALLQGVLRALGAMEVAS